ncbi:MAG TPA: preprotein translocase subunit YajC [Ignavibacteriaceae bacterium]|nr:MAG: preprotein translocase subunit YajC [Ignavibacteria bacterium ADurb.Bin266]HQF42877.1 preprotein translocase subunit YajC [Ignavibacteriaceae bacterium]HQI40835.1 preprotein translocase subunit YajC [Ignavibacteriaceae bacterium]HQJ46011.1 preprotein translocase subunit YajC [Ignavibacteriaceae bacterium]
MDIFLAMAPQGGEAGGGSLISTLIMFGAIFAIFYFMIIRPQQKRAKEREKLLSNIEKGDKIITSGGVHATIVGIEEKTVLIEIAPNVKIKIERSAIGSVVK